MKDEDVAALLTKVIALLEGPSGGGCSCGKCCSCTTDPTLEASAVRFNEQQAFVAAESSKAFVQQQTAQFQQMLTAQQEFTKSVNA